MKILFAFPSRSRPAKFRTTLHKLITNLHRPELCCINVIVDNDDAKRNEYYAITEEYRHRIRIEFPCVQSTCKIDAVNKAAQCESFDWDIVVVMSDDMHVVLQGIDERIRRDMERYYPNRDGLLHYNDGSANHKLITFAIMGRKLYELFIIDDDGQGSRMPDGAKKHYVYHPAYKSLWCDNEQMAVADWLGRRVYIPLQIVEHKHPNHGGKYARENDAQYKHTESFDKVDKATFYKRQAMNFDLPLLTICVPTVVGREKKFDRLMADLEKQRSRLSDPNWVQIIFDKDNKEKSIGQKRDDLLRRSLGLFVQMTDDDDLLHPQALYMWTYLILQDQDAYKLNPKKHNCITNIGFLEQCSGGDFGTGTLVDRSARYPDWGDNVAGYKHVRTPDNKNPIRTALCIAAGGYSDMRYGEDHDFSKRVLPLLKNEAYIRQELYYYKYTKEEHTVKYGITV